ncbi:toll/interleukin-1 receptor domain-containing protein [Flavilitoribacter nigricans]|uniref:Response regulator n=1 Tax=Flavilitoribacter nigricans (strain ATCC 23147 / DSM 23189 / NBRC 102662 / NCIMB 1420 / SS-2) TaxID=1122177 RepID=A0A2D0N4K5_FLAN2|nr:toll/interleukin-1 receptor domain-containing protein [Flavilitoribacter nigricans]PHN03451.1 hypothetical protein CRP01_27610 [Flavilitoribacter nigricans DSM 23189 = NBRC 102662]
MSTSRSILWVEDDVDTQMEMQKAFGEKYKIVFSPTSRSAEILLLEGPSNYDLVVVDLFLESMSRDDGLNLIKYISRTHPVLPVIAVTGEGRHEDLLSAHRLGASHSFIKTDFDGERWGNEFENYLKPYVFISYSSKNRAFAELLENRLTPHCRKVWLDNIELKGGAVPIREIAEGIRKATHFLPILSEAYLQSDWVEKEYDIVSRQEISGLTRVIPITYGIHEADVPNYFTQLRIDFGKVLNLIGHVDLHHAVFHKSARPMHEIFDTALQELDQQFERLLRALRKRKPEKY